MYISALNKQENFGAGKVHIYSDFDGTYCPARHCSLHNPDENAFMVDYCKKMRDFFAKNKKNVDFHVTTGRTFGEYEAISWLLKMRDFELPLPDSFIAKNGSDEYIKIGKDSDFYKKGVFPFQYGRTNECKEEAIKSATNWDGKKIKEFIKNLAQRYHLRFVEGDSEFSVKDYGEKSLFSEGKLQADEWRKLPQANGVIQQHKTPIVNFDMGSRNDGNLKVNLIFSPDYGFCEERTQIYDGFQKEIKDYMKQHGIKFADEWETAEQGVHRRISWSITPEIDGHSLTKLYDTKQALKEAIQNNNIVVVAGDGSNDFRMLNPLEYMDEAFVENCKQSSKYKEFYSSNMYDRIKTLKQVLTGSNEDYVSGLRQELSNNGFLKKLKELPLYSIIISKDNNDLKLLAETFASTGKIVCVDKGELDKGVLSAIKDYSEKNKLFKNGFQGIIEKEFKPKSKTAKVVACCCLAALAIFGGYKWLGNDKGMDNASKQVEST